MSDPLPDQPEGRAASSDSVFFKVSILVFLAILTYLLLPSLSPVSIGVSVFLLLLLSHRRARFELGV